MKPPPSVHLRPPGVIPSAARDPLGVPAVARGGRRSCAALLSLVLASSCSRKPSPGPPDAPLFREAAAQTGLRFHHFTGSTGQYYMPEIMGAGVAVFDYDNDGDLDVYLVQGTMLDSSRQPAAAKFPPPPDWKPGNRLFRNELNPSGQLRFTDVTAPAGVGHVGYGMGVSAGDYNNDGHPDLYVTNFGPNVLYRNNGDGAFTDVTRQAGVDDPRWSASAAFLDYDRDGRLDLYVTNYLDFTIRGNKQCFDSAGERDYCTPSVYRPAPDRLFRNQGNGRFEDVTVRAGIGKAVGPGLGVLAADFNADGFTDIYVANDGAANLLWINQRDGTFLESALMSGAAYSADGIARAGMGVTAGDMDGDGDDDLLVTNLAREGSTLYRNDGRGNFTDATMELGLHTPTFASTGFGVGWFDYDNDGRLDLFAANGGVTIVEAQRGEPYPFRQRNQVFHNQGTGRLRETTGQAGQALAAMEISRGAAFGDIDNDGDLDIVVSNNNGPARLLLNQTGARRHWLLVGLEGVRSNRDGAGARVTVLRDGEPPLVRRAHTDGSYLTSNDIRVHFGLGDRPGVRAIVVQWPDGSKERWQQSETNRLVRLKQGSGRSE